MNDRFYEILICFIIGILVGIWGYKVVLAIVKLWVKP